MRARLAAVFAVTVAMSAVVLTGAAATPMNVTMTPTSGPNGTTVTASSNDTCPAPPPSSNSGTVNDGPIILQQAVPAQSPPPESESNWFYVTESDGTIEDGNAPWSGTFSVGGTGEERLAPGSYTVYFACGYIPTSPPSGGLPATDGSPTAYGDYTAKAFEICADGTQTCSSSTTATSTTTTTVNTTTAPTTTSTSAAPASTTTTTTVATTNVASTRPGGIVDVTAIGFKPNSTGTVDFESAPVRVATFAANSNGDVSVAVRIPSRAAAGLHHIVLTGVDPNGAPRTLRVAINVAGIVRTGASSTLLLAIAAALVVIGVVVRTATGDRRPRAAHLRSR